VSRHLPGLVILVPLLTAVTIPVLGMLHRRLPWLAALAASTFSFFGSVSLVIRVMETGRISYHLGGWAPPWGIEYAVDALNGFVLVVVSFVAALVALYSLRSVDQEIPRAKHPAFYSIYMLLVTGLMGIVVTGDIFNMYVFIEISSLASYALIASGRRREALTASYNYLILGTIGATFILLGIGHLYMATGSLNIADLSRLLPPLYGSGVVLTAFAYFSVGLALKLALFPLHIWMPNAYTHAPSSVSAVLAATATKVGAYALIRVMFTVFNVHFDVSSVPFSKILLFLSCIAILAGSVLAISQTNIKRMLAYSSVGQIGYIVFGAALINKTAMAGSLLHILNHALMKGALFLVVIGVPLTVGFVSKWYLALGAIEAGMWYLVPVILLSSLLTAVYFWRIIEGIYFGKPAVEGERLEQPMGMLVPTAVMAALCVVFGVSATLPLAVAKAAANMLLGGGA
jgi:multicomponent Na+:H+ antiporter subunit D